MLAQPDGPPGTQKARARQYALCTVALRYDRISAGAEGVFDQALTNGLAAIVAHMWPGKEIGRRGRVKSAAELLEVIAEEGVAADGGTIQVVYERGEEPEPEPEPETQLVEDPFGGPSRIFERTSSWMPNYITVNAAVLKGAIEATQAIRHARATDADTDVTLSEEQIEALDALSYHPALDGMSEHLYERVTEDDEAADRAEAERALAYLKLLREGGELERRAAIDYRAEYEYHYPDARVEVYQCPVCENYSLVAHGHDGWIGEVGIGQCVVCGYQRSSAVADDIAMGIQIRRAADRDD
ncbi:hypothetical protein NE235_14910 [Actinoallomurus spadix]|uniref:Uncharacterized protein n=1 Tax=Actinoallomurus spadix TaxID=79912 RepID=A0ABN0WFE4_9ACTN|nr:hypothetical protein [Actinoallomurus spadix]MCO5987394.1 hypothetical protein [Actinoallomurus spadix]